MEPALIHLSTHPDQRGELSVMEFGSGQLPFMPQRQFVVRNVPKGAVRGLHANVKVHELLICAQGSMEVLMDDGERRSVVRLDSPAVALHLPNMVWSEQRNFSADAVLVVLASLPYDSTNYIRNYDQFLRVKASHR